MRINPMFHSIIHTRPMVGFSFNDENGLWVKISYYSHPAKNMPDITLLPMVHLGEQDFYDEINHEMWRHDTAYLEGCYAPGRRGYYIIHRLVAWRSKLALQSGKIRFFKRWHREPETNSNPYKLQERLRTFSCDCGECYNFKLRQVRADFHHWHTARAIKAMPRWSKVCFPFLLIAGIIAAPFFSLRDFALNDEEDEEDEECGVDSLFERFFKPYMKFVSEDRDLFLRMVLSEEILDDKNSNKKLCIKYGAKHMPVLAKTFLEDFDYELVEQRHVLAIAKNKSVNFEEIETGYDYAYEKLWENDKKKPQSTPTEWKHSPVSTDFKGYRLAPVAVPEKHRGVQEQFGFEQNPNRLKIQSIEVDDADYTVKD